MNVGKGLESIKGLIGAVAPSLATALGGPLAGMAVAKIAQAITGKADTTGYDVAAAIQSSSDPDLLLKLKQADQEFAEHMRQLDIDLEGIAQKDRESARGREVATHDLTPRILAFAVVALTMIGEGYVLLHGIPSTTDGVVVGRILGTLDAALILVLSYYFGTSSGESRSREIMANQVAGRRQITGDPGAASSS